MNKNKLKIKCTYLVCTILLIVLIIFSILWYYENRFFRRSIHIQSISMLKKELQETFSINELTVNSKRGWHCYFIINIDESDNNDTYDEIFAHIQHQVNQGLAKEIIKYAKDNYSDALIPKVNRFYISIYVNKSIVYSKNLLVETE